MADTDEALVGRRRRPAKWESDETELMRARILKSLEKDLRLLVAQAIHEAMKPIAATIEEHLSDQKAHPAIQRGHSDDFLIRSFASAAEGIKPDERAKLNTMWDERNEHRGVFKAMLALNAFAILAIPFLVVALNHLWRY